MLINSIISSVSDIVSVVFLIEAFTYTFGLLFEMARVLKNAKDKNGYVYYDVN